LVIQRGPESVWERRVKVARDFPETMKSKEVYDRLGLDSQKPRDKRVASRFMRAAGFVAKRGRRRAVWEKEEREVTSLSPPPHHTNIVSLSLLNLRCK